MVKPHPRAHRQHTSPYKYLPMSCRLLDVVISVINCNSEYRLILEPVLNSVLIMHFSNGLRSVDREPVYVAAIHIDISFKASTNPNYEVTIEDIDEWICEHGPIPPRSFVIINTGWSFKRGARYLGPESIMDQDILGNTIDQDVLGLLPLLVPELFGFSWPGISESEW